MEAKKSTFTHRTPMCQEPVTWHMVQTARRMKQRGYDTDEICKITGLPREEIEAL